MTMNNYWKEFITETLEKEIAKYDWHNFPVSIVQGFIKREAIETSVLSSMSVEEKDLAIKQVCGCVNTVETDGINNVEFYVGAFDWTYFEGDVNVLNAVKAAFGIETLTDYIVQTVRHEHRHVEQYVALRAAGFDLRKAIKVEGFQGQYGMGPLENDAFTTQCGRGGTIQQFVENYKVAEAAYDASVA